MTTATSTLNREFGHASQPHTRIPSRGTDMGSNKDVRSTVKQHPSHPSRAKLLTCHARALNVALTGSANSAAMHGATRRNHNAVENPGIQSPDQILVPCSTQQQLDSRRV